MAELTRSSVMAVMEESTEGTPVIPSGASDYTALQDGFDVDPAFNVLETTELRSSIGVSKPILGLEQPTGSFAHYIRHSGVEGTAPDFNLFLKAAFGAETAQSTQRTTTTGSTTSVVELAAGGSDYARGKAILVKDGTNGYSIRPVHSVSSNSLTLGFNLTAAPASGVSLGKYVNYSPVNSGHPSLSIWMYRGNGGAIEMLSGARVTELSVDINAGEIINGSFSLAGVKYHYDPINILSTDTKLDFLDNVTTRVATIAVGLYRDPHELASALQTSMNSLGSANTFTVSYSDIGANAGKFTISSTGSTLSLLWNTGANTANTVGDKIGFSTAADDTGALTYTSDNAQSWVSPYSPSYDSADPLVAKDNELLIGDSDDTVALCAQSASINMALTRQEIACVSAVSGVAGSIISQREVTVDVVALMERHDVDKLRRFRSNSDTRLLYNAGEKVGGNWVAGKCVSFYMPSASIPEFKLGDGDGLVTVEFQVKAYVDSSGNGEFYLNFL